MSIGTSQLLLFLSAVAGIGLLGGTMLLLWFRRIYIDAQTGQPTEIEIPLIGKFKTQAPTFALIIVAAILIIYPISRAKQDFIRIQGEVHPGNKQLTLVVITLPHNLTERKGDGKFDMPVPLIENAAYRVQYEIDGQVVSEADAELDKKGIYKVKEFTFAPQGSSKPIRPRAEQGVTDEKMRSLGIVN